MTTILIVDDEHEMRQLIQITLQNHGYNTIAASGGDEAYSIVAQQDVNLVLLDVMMPGDDGFTVCKTIRQIANIPIIFLTALDAVEDKVKGLMLGGDDYIVKPFTLSELSARIFAVLRRYNVDSPHVDEASISHGPIKIDLSSRNAYINQQHVTLTLKEFELLNLFLQKQNVVFSREQLLAQIWGDDYLGGTRTVDTHIKTLRLKLAKHSRQAADLIETVWGIGYRLGVIE